MKTKRLDQLVAGDKVRMIGGNVATITAARPASWIRFENRGKSIDVQFTVKGNKGSYVGEAEEEVNVA